MVRAATSLAMITFVSVSCLPAIFASLKIIFGKSVAHLLIVRQHFYSTLNYLRPLAFISKNSENDTFTVKQMLQQDDVADFIT